MKGYWLGFSYMGYLPSEGKYCEFENEEEYITYFRTYEES